MELFFACKLRGFSWMQNFFSKAGGHVRSWVIFHHFQLLSTEMAQDPLLDVRPVIEVCVLLLKTWNLARFTGEAPSWLWS